MLRLHLSRHVKFLNRYKKVHLIESYLLFSVFNKFTLYLKIYVRLIAIIPTIIILIFTDFSTETIFFIYQNTCFATYRNRNQYLFLYKSLDFITLFTQLQLRPQLKSF